METTTTVLTSVTAAQLAEATGGYDPLHSDDRVWVRCPADYDVAAITAEDIVHDDAIVTVEAQ